MKKLILLLAIAASLHATATAASDDSLFTFDGVIGGGYVYNISDFTYGVDGLSHNGGNGFARLLWSPEHILDVGVEIGFTNLYSIRPAGESAIESSSLVAYPFYLVLSMKPVDRFAVTIGYGMAILSSVVDDGTTQTGVTSPSTSVYGSVAYMAPIDERLRIGGEARLTSFDRYRDANLSFNVLLSYSLIRY